ncbi:MAG: hypothetical protein GF421_04520 [Candidatus Aminicenantes bacterium]|nr:hypothetical protein [Candidatus Aminicenantes bacterium]
MQNTADKIKNAYRSSMYIHLAVMGTLLVYIAVVELIGTRFSAYAIRASYLSSLRYIFYGITIVVIFIIRRLQSAFKLKPRIGRMERSLNRMLKVSVITSILCEIPAVLGLVYFFLKGVKRDFYYLIILSAVLLLLYFPKYAKWQPFAERENRVED